MTDDYTKCFNHSDYDDDCEYCREEVQVLQNKYTETMQHVQNCEKRLQSMHAGVPTELLIGTRLDMLIQAIFQNPKQMGRFENSFADAILEVHKKVEQSVRDSRAQKLLVPNQTIKPVGPHRGGLG